MKNPFKFKKEIVNEELFNNDIALPHSEECPDEEVIFSVKNFQFYYDNGAKHALKDINLEIFKRKVTAFIGPSGCGKSTLLRCFNRMNDLIDGNKKEGEILYKGTPIDTLNTIQLRSKVGMVFQQPNPFPMSIYNNITYGPKLSPDIILMDEPTSALDPIATLKIEELIRKLKEKYTIIIVTHNMQQAARISDYTAFFMLGELVEFNKTEEFFAHPKNKKSEDYITGKFS